MMLMMLALLASIISVIGVPFLLLPGFLAAWAHWARPDGVPGGYACHLCFAAKFGFWVLLMGGG